MLREHTHNGIAWTWEIPRDTAACECMYTCTAVTWSVQWRLLRVFFETSNLITAAFPIGGPCTCCDANGGAAGIDRTGGFCTRVCIIHKARQVKWIWSTFPKWFVKVSNGSKIIFQKSNLHQKVNYFPMNLTNLSVTNVILWYKWKTKRVIPPNSTGRFLSVFIT